MVDPLMKYHPDLSISRLQVGVEQVPVLVVDNFVAEPAQLVETARSLQFAPLGQYYPGIRAPASRAYQQALARAVAGLWRSLAPEWGGKLKLTLCHYSLVTTPPDQLHMLQRIPHYDSTGSNGLASVHYLFEQPLGGTAFYRHRKTGFETITQTRVRDYLAALEAETGGPDLPPAQYINGDTALFEQLLAVESRFNRLILYPRNVLHSGSIAADFPFEADPAKGRLSINSFMDLV